MSSVRNEFEPLNKKNIKVPAFYKENIPEISVTKVEKNIYLESRQTSPHQKVTLIQN